MRLSSSQPKMQSSHAENQSFQHLILIQPTWNVKDHDSHWLEACNRKTYPEIILSPYKNIHFFLGGSRLRPWCFKDWRYCRILWNLSSPREWRKFHVYIPVLCKSSKAILLSHTKRVKSSAPLV
jgi:hypothetical protein